MPLDINSKIFYPSHGAGWIVKKKNIEFCGKEQEYFEFKFVNSPLTISTPIDKLKTLGVREVISVDKMLNLLKKLGETVKKSQTDQDYNKFIEEMKELDNTGNAANFVEIIIKCGCVRDSRKEDKRIIPVNITKSIKNSIIYLVAELAVIKDLTMEEAVKEFEEITKIKVDL